jgi:uncharacterized protein (TIGR02757 family)
MQLHDFLESKYQQYAKPNFIPYDPICIPHRFSVKQDIEISAFFAAILAWGQRKTIINKCTELMNFMDNSPFQFVTQHTESDLKGLSKFVHRTFNATDLLYFIDFFKRHYSQYSSLEDAFLFHSDAYTIAQGLSNFNTYFFDADYAPHRTQKHISTPQKKSACKRLNMFLRWMVRTNKEGVDFGIWKQIPSHLLVCPCDVHVDRVARKLGLIHRKQTDWLAAVELTENLKKYDAQDPVKYDFALFGLGIEEKF